MNCDLQILIGRVKNDPEGYREEFTRQKAHFEHLMQLMLLDPSVEHPQFSQIAQFLAHVSFA
jgi:hypothetical protein